jgi:hypothetical protein
MANKSDRAARASIWIALAGFALPVAALFVGREFVAPKNAVLGQRMCLGLFVLSELIALACGFKTRSNARGKAGLMLSIFLLLAVLGTLFVHLHVR